MKEHKEIIGKFFLLIIGIVCIFLVGLLLKIILYLDIYIIEKIFIK